MTQHSTAARLDKQLRYMKHHELSIQGQSQRRTHVIVIVTQQEGLGEIRFKLLHNVPGSILLAAC